MTDVGLGFPISKVPQHAVDAIPRWMISSIKEAEKPKTVAKRAFGVAMWLKGYGRLKEYGLPVTAKTDTKKPDWAQVLFEADDPFWQGTPTRIADRDAALKNPLFWRKQHTTNPVEDVGKAIASGAKVIASAGGDAAAFVKKQTEEFAKDPVGKIASVATSGGLSLIGVHPEQLLKQAGIPTPDEMLSKLGIPSPATVARTAYSSVTDPKQLLSRIPGVKELAKYVPSMPDPTQMAANLVAAAASGDLEKVEHAALDVGHQVSDVVSMVPGAGNVIGGPLSAALTLIETGSALKAALQLLLSEVPGIPPQVRDILRTALNGIADIVEGEKAVTDILVTEFKKGVNEQVKKNGVPAPIAELVDNVLDGAVQVIFRHRPIDKAALDFAEKGLAAAAKKANVPELQKAQKALSDLQGIYSKVNTIQALTRGISQLAKKDPQKRDPIVQKQIADIRAAIDAQHLLVQGHSKQVDANLGKRGGMPVLAAVKPKAPEPPPPMKAVQPKASPKTPPKVTAAPAYAPYPKMPGATHGLGFTSDSKWRWFTVFSNGRPIVQRGPMWLSDHAALQETAGLLEATQGRGYYGTVTRWDWDGQRWQERDGGTLNAPPHPHHSGGRRHRPAFRGGGRGHPGWWGPWQGVVPFEPEVVTTVETCRTWGDPVAMPALMQTAAKAALGASGGKPTTTRGPDGVLYLFAYENGALTARPCAAVTVSP